MKNYSDYKRIIATNYPNLKESRLTEGKYKVLYKQWLLGSPKGDEGLFNGACDFAYYMLAGLYAKRILHGDFEDALQDTYLILRHAGRNQYVSQNVKDRVAGCMPTKYNVFLKKVADCVVYSLIEMHEKEEKNNQPVQNEMLENLLNDPESVALSL